MGADLHAAGTSRSAARAARREQIIAAGLACFARSGYHATTMADVAAQARVSKGTLFLALHEQWNCGAGRRVDAAIAALHAGDRGSPRRVLHAVAAAIAEHVTAQPETCRVLMEALALAAHEPAIAAAVRAADARTHEQLEGLIAAGVRAGEWPDGTDPALAAAHPRRRARHRHRRVRRPTADRATTRRPGDRDPE